MSKTSRGSCDVTAEIWSHDPRIADRTPLATPQFHHCFISFCQSSHSHKDAHVACTCPAVTACPLALLVIPAPQERSALVAPPSTSTPPPSVFRCLCLIYPFLSDKVSGDQRHLLHLLWRCVLLLNYVQGQGLVCLQRHWECMANRWWETTCMPSDK